MSWDELLGDCDRAIVDEDVEVALECCRSEWEGEERAELDADRDAHRACCWILSFCSWVR